ncbi:MAG: NAD-dependent epimerase/dehydratase family protein [Chitinophagaceae bacterium]|nr:MAG: NAD-dependent epimerase/dehydratase family protein [Chitinophagaceae bacterium]
MILTIFGATGTTGRELVQQALITGHTVKAFGRNVFATDFLKHDNLQLLQGALFDPKDVKQAIKNSDAVLSVIGGAIDGTDKSRSLGIKNIIAQMEATSVKRIVALGGMGVLPAEDGCLLMDAEDYPQEYLPVGIEHRRAYELLRASSLDWTFIAAPDLVEAPATGSFSTTSESMPSRENPHINTGDLALFMLNELTKNHFIRQRVGITN